MREARPVGTNLSMFRLIGGTRVPPTKNRHVFPRSGISIVMAADIRGSSKIFSNPERDLRHGVCFAATAPNPPAVPVKAMRCNARMALIILETEEIPFNLLTGQTSCH